jgi:hypothetical protein
MRKVIAAVLLLAVVWAVPGGKARVSAFALASLEPLGPRGETVAAPLRQGVARARVAGIVRAVAADYEKTRMLPEPRDFSRWLNVRFKGERDADPWGNPFWMERTRHQITVGSSGPDGRRGTPDDVTQSIPF